MTQNWRSVITAAALWATCHLGLAQSPPATILEIQGNNWVAYYGDVFDYSKIATDPGIAIALSPTKPFQFYIDIVDIVTVNGKPARGTWVTTGSPQVRLTPNATPGASTPSAIADVGRGAVTGHYLEILQPDGTPVGTILVSGMSQGSPPPGAPRALGRDNLIVLGGTGAFLGTRGQAGNAVDASLVTARVTSISEDPANRRLHGGGSKRLVVHLIPMFRPEVVVTAAGPAVVHSSDYSLVTAAKPAKSGEILTLFASGLGPTRPGVDPGQPFTANPPQVANSPIEVLVNGKSGDVLYAGGYPGAVDNYQINFRVPDGIAPGPASLQLVSAWIAGSEVRVAIQ
jgi:hypothetical protein